MPELFLSVQDSGMFVLSGNHKITQTLEGCLPSWLMHEPLPGPFPYPVISVAVEDGQVPREQPILAPQATGALKDSIPE